MNIFKKINKKYFINYKAYGTDLFILEFPIRILQELAS